MRPPPPACNCVYSDNIVSCAEIYSTGRANLPGSIVERQLHESFARMLPELLRYSSASHLLSLIPEEIQDIHRTDASKASGSESRAQTRHAPASNHSSLLWDGWEDASEVPGAAGRVYGSSDEEDVDLSAMGL